MILASLYIRADSECDFDSFVVRLFSALGVGEFEKRESSNYPGGEYVKGAALGYVMRASIADDSDFSEYQYWLGIETRAGIVIADKTPLSGVGDLVARHLANSGFAVALDVDIGKKGGRRVLFASLCQ
jgi:hypothetical protein